ncbi:MAG: formate--tetrahydrofolate ligase [bacterium]|nr:formate--tetrahydrofolate ligase [bacterium]
MSESAGNLKRIDEVAGDLKLEAGEIVKYGEYVAKVKIAASERFKKKGKLILVTAMNPTPYGEGKTTVSIGLADALNSIGRKSSVVLREPSLGPVFGVKGGATGGGKATVLPSEDINLHFTGDIHAVTSAHNLLAALVDNSYSRTNVSHFQPKDIFFHRVIDMNDRALRKVVIGVGEESGQIRESKFEITAASEIMAILGLSTDIENLKERLSNIIVGESVDFKPVLAKILESTDALAILLKNALNPNLVQTGEGNPAFVHAGPFANIAHGTASIVSADLALKTSEFAVMEAGFGSDLGGEKFFDIVSRQKSMSPPDAVVIVATLRAVKHHGGVKQKDLLNKDADAIVKGFSNLEKHIENMLSFNRPVVVAINRFKDDSNEELEILLQLCREKHKESYITDVYKEGGNGILNAAEAVIKACEEKIDPVNYVYEPDDSIEEKIRKVAYRIYGAYGMAVSKKMREKMKKIEEWGYGKLPVCIAKTQYSFSDNEKLLGRPRNFNIEVRDLKVSGGAGFIVVYLGNIMTMPGLPEIPASTRMKIDSSGSTSGV